MRGIMAALNCCAEIKSNVNKAAKRIFLVLILSLLQFTWAAPSAKAQDDAGARMSVIPEEWETWLDDMILSPRLLFRDQSILGADVFILRPTNSERYRHPIYRTQVPRLQRLLSQVQPGVDELARKVSAANPKTILIAPIFQTEVRGTAAYTDCSDSVQWLNDTTEHVLRDGKACLIVVDLSVLEAENDMDGKFILAHELFHTVQNMTFEGHEAEQGAYWWSEGSANWFAYSAVHGATYHDHKSADFLDLMDIKPLNEFSYPAQVFHFWASRYFDQEYVLGMGFHGDDRLATLSGAADTMAPEHWLEWASVHLNPGLSYPDGRPLPSAPSTNITVPVPAERSSCREDEEDERAGHTAPPLSAQLLTLHLEGDTSDKTLRVHAADAWVRILGAGGKIDIQTGTKDIPLSGQQTLKAAAIVPGTQGMQLWFEIIDPRTEMGSAARAAASSNDNGSADSSSAVETASTSCGCDPLPAGHAPIDACIIGDWEYVSGGASEWLEMIAAFAPSLARLDAEIQEDNVSFCSNGVFTAHRRSRTQGTFTDGGAFDTPGNVVSSDRGVFATDGNKLQVHLSDGQVAGVMNIYGDGLVGTVNLSGPESASSVNSTFECSETSLIIKTRVPDVPAMVPPIVTKYRRR